MKSENQKSGFENRKWECEWEWEWLWKSESEIEIAAFEMRCEKCQEGRDEGRRLGGCAPVVAATSPSRQGWARTRGATTCRSSSATCLSCARTPCSTKALFAGQKAQELDPELAAYEHFFFLDLFILKWKVRISFEVRMSLREKWESIFWVLATKVRTRVGVTLIIL